MHLQLLVRHIGQHGLRHQLVLLAEALSEEVPRTIILVRRRRSHACSHPAAKMRLSEKDARSAALAAARAATATAGTGAGSGSGPGTGVGARTGSLSAPNRHFGQFGGEGGTLIGPSLGLPSLHHLQELLGQFPSSAHSQDEHPQVDGSPDQEGQDEKPGHADTDEDVLPPGRQVVPGWSKRKRVVNYKK